MLLLDNSPRTTPLPVFWSPCIEEHFYLVWLLPVRRLSSLSFRYFKQPFLRLRDRLTGP